MTIQVLVHKRPERLMNNIPCLNHQMGLACAGSIGAEPTNIKRSLPPNLFFIFRNINKSKRGLVIVPVS